jgi:Co/Zn/Cd efflux system component
MQGKGSISMEAESQTGADHGCCDTCQAQAAPMASRRVFWLQWLTIGWMVLECAVALVSASRARSVALLAFGADSFVELLSASVVLMQYLPGVKLRGEVAERAAAVLLYALAAAVALIAALSFRHGAETSLSGMAITALALVFMPLLAWMKRRYARATGDAALRADAAQSATCAYLAAVTLAGLAVNAAWHITWVDSVAALAAIPVVLVEARRTWRGEGCNCAAV